MALALQLRGPTARCLQGVGAPLGLDDDRSWLARSVLGVQQLPAGADVDGAGAAGGLDEHADHPPRVSVTRRAATTVNAPPPSLLIR